MQKVTCWTCHHGRDIPATTIALETVYDSPNKENDDIVQPDRSQPTPAQVFEKYYTALGGKDKVAAVNSFVATGQSIGYEGLGGNASFTIYSQKPNKRTTLIQYKDTSREDSAWAFNGTTGWINTPRALITPTQPDCSRARTTSCGNRISPLPTTGTGTAVTTDAIASQSAAKR